jgi:hypothetical protein
MAGKRVLRQHKARAHRVVRAHLKKANTAMKRADRIKAKLKKARA